MDCAPKKYQKAIHAGLLDMYHSKTIEEACKKRDMLIEEYRDVADKAMERLDNGFESVMTVMALPENMRRFFRTTNHLERLNREVKRRSTVINVFPNVQSIIRIIGSVLLEQNDIYLTQHKIGLTKKDFEELNKTSTAKLLEIAKEIKRYEELPIKEIWLVDIEDGKEKVEIVGALAQRMWDASPYDVKVYTTLDRREALKDADFVTTQFRVGLLDARIKDERIPSLYGMLGQETNGAGGMFKAFRTIPVIGQIIEDMRELCPDAWLINFTNPSGMVTEAVIKHFGWKKCIGLCNVPTIAMMAEPKLLGKDISQLNYRYAGINHFHWHKVFDENGNDMTPILIDHINEKGGGTPANIYQAEFPLELLHSMNMVPCGYHRYYYMKQAMLEHAIEEFNEGGTRAEQMKQVEHELFEIYKNSELHEKPEQLGKRGGAYYSDAACECIRAIYANKKIHMVVSTQNNGAISCLDDDSIVEVSSIISATGAQPMAFGKLPSAEKGWLQMMKAMEECTIEAALTGDYGKALEAFVLNPLVENNENTTKVLDELLVAHAKYLPQFKEKIEELKAKGVHSTDPVVMDLMEHGH